MRAFYNDPLRRVLLLLWLISLSSQAFTPSSVTVTSRNARKAHIRIGYERLLSQALLSKTALSAAMRFKNFEQVLDTFHEEPVFIYFNTANCGPCQLMKKEMATVKEMVGKKVKVFSIDTEIWPHVGSRFEIARLPTLVLVREGEIRLRLEGVNSAASIIEQIEGLL